MELTIQDLESVKPTIESHFKRYPNASVSAMFRKLRKSPRVSFFGDYPILSLIITTMNELGIIAKKLAVRRVFWISEDLKGQRSVLRQLLSNQLTTRYETQTPVNERNYPKNSDRPSKRGEAHV